MGLILPDYKLTASTPKSRKGIFLALFSIFRIKISRMKRFGIGVLSFFAWLFLFIAAISVTVSLTMGQINNAGAIAQNAMKDFSTNPTAINSLIDQLKTNSDPQFIKAIDENRTAINQTIKSLAGSAQFQADVKSALDQLAAGISAGKSSVDVNFRELANLAAQKINAAAKSQIVTEKDLASIKPLKVDIHKQSDFVNKIKGYAHLALLSWIAWLFLLIACWRLGAKSIFVKSGRQLISVGLLIILIRVAAPMIGSRLASQNSDSQFTSSQVTKISGEILSPMLAAGVGFTVVGVLLILVPRFTGKREQQELPL